MQREFSGNPTGSSELKPVLKTIGISRARSNSGVGWRCEMQ